MNHTTSRGSKETLALLKLRTSAFYLINWSNGGMKLIGQMTPTRNQTSGHWYG